MSNQKYLIQTNTSYFSKVLNYYGIEHTRTPHISNDFLYIKGFNEYNYLHEINLIFSTCPTGNVVDRTEKIKFPFNFFISRPWKTPTNKKNNLDNCFFNAVKSIELHNSKINLMWSGGIDSTAVVIGFLKHSSNLSQIRILYTTMSINENPNFYKTLANTHDIELVDIGNDYYLTQKLDGVFVNGDGGDDLTASLDQSFFEDVGLDGLKSNWEDLFYKKNPSTDFIDFCKSYFDQSGTQISSVLEARWWFYTNSKIDKFPAKSSSLLNFNQPLMIGFFNHYDFEEYFFFNIDKIIINNDYRTYKHLLKQYIFDYTNDNEYFLNKIKFNSFQMAKYAEKVESIKNQQYIMLLGDGTRIRTNNLPFLSELEFRQKYQNTLDYLFNV